MACQPRNQRRAELTLIETVVAIGLLSSVSALLVPTLSQAREDAKRLTCRSHLGRIARALLSYQSDHDRLPFFGTRGETWMSWQYGGWSGRNRAYWEKNYPWRNVQTSERPLTIYMTPWSIPDEIDRFTPTQETPLFQCPSDGLSSLTEQSGADYLMSAYDDIGTSYHLNFFWAPQAKSMDCPPSEPDPCTAYQIEVLGNEIFERYQRQDAARFIMLMEDPADWGLSGGGFEGKGIQTMGYHGEFSKHMVAFADGHVEYMTMDTRHRHESPPNPPGPRHERDSFFGTWTVVHERLDHPDGGRHTS